ERFFVGSAVECIPDAQGRIALPQNLRDYAEITEDIEVVGLGAKVELWATHKWEQFNAALTDEVIEALGSDLGILV
ncbi:MAG: MraZ C-terminal domain-containing protein, partial [Armatimonadota bacterium]